MKLTFNLEVSVEQSAHRAKIVIDSFKGESTWHVTLKLLAYLLFIESRPSIEADAGWHYKPDLFSRSADGRIALWVECGHVDTRKIDSIATKMGADGEFFIMRRHLRSMQDLKTAVHKKIRRPERVKLVSFDGSFVDDIALLLGFTNDINANRRGSVLRLTLTNGGGKSDFTTQVHIVSLDPRA